MFVHILKILLTRHKVYKISLVRTLDDTEEFQDYYKE